MSFSLLGKHTPLDGSTLHAPIQIAGHGSGEQRNGRCEAELDGEEEHVLRFLEPCSNVLTHWEFLRHCHS